VQGLPRVGGPGGPEGPQGPEEPRGLEGGFIDDG